MPSYKPRFPPLKHYGRAHRDRAEARYKAYRKAHPIAVRRRPRLAGKRYNRRTRSYSTAMQY